MTDNENDNSTHVAKGFSDIVVSGAKSAGWLRRGLERGVGDEGRGAADRPGTWPGQATGRSDGRTPSAASTIKLKEPVILANSE